MAKAVYAGSFDPFTNGHLHVVQQASGMFDKVVVLFAINPDKKRRIDVGEMLEALDKTLDTKGLNNVFCGTTDGLVADYAVQHGFDCLIRGIRNGMDYEYEEAMAKINERLGVQTVYIRAGELGYISSSMVMELLRYDKDIREYVPDAVYPLLIGGK